MNYHENALEIAKELPLWSCIPFLGMLLSIAIIPLVKPEWWEKNQLWVSLGWSAMFIILFGVVYGMGQMTYQMLETILVDYIPFIVLLFGLFVVTGGIVVKGTLAGSTKTNVVMLLIGTGLASWLGTTGAAMLMIRPLIRANSWREKKVHVIVFFIFLVANMGGCLTPVGDPPLLLGFIRGVPFFWTMNLAPILLTNVVILITLFIIIDRRCYKKEIENGNAPDVGAKEPLKIEGAHNFVFVAMIIIAVILNGALEDVGFFAGGNGITICEVTMKYTMVLEIIIILLAAFLSLSTTKKSVREDNDFNFAPIAEVAKLFIGIFTTMIPALAILKASSEGISVTEPYQFFWITGLLSSFLDNAPTYLVFVTMAGAKGFMSGISTAVGMLPESVLIAISAGAVFMGACTYIGNAPNFMVKSIAEHEKIKMPGFFGYMKWSLMILIPLFLIDNFVFFR